MFLSEFLLLVMMNFCFRQVQIRNLPQQKSLKLRIWLFSIKLAPARSRTEITVFAGLCPIHWTTGTLQHLSGFIVVNHPKKTRRSFKNLNFYLIFLWLKLIYCPVNFIYLYFLSKWQKKFTLKMSRKTQLLQ